MSQNVVGRTRPVSWEPGTVRAIAKRKGNKEINKRIRSNGVIQKSIDSLDCVELSKDCLEILKHIGLFYLDKKGLLVRYWIDTIEGHDGLELVPYMLCLPKVQFEILVVRVHSETTRHKGVNVFRLLRIFII